jgi:hypothetical protein
MIVSKLKLEVGVNSVFCELKLEVEVGHSFRTIAQVRTLLPSFACGWSFSGCPNNRIFGLFCCPIVSHNKPPGGVLAGARGLAELT